MTFHVRPLEKHGAASFYEGDDASGLPVLDRANGFLEPLGELFLGDITFRLCAVGLWLIAVVIRVRTLIAERRYHNLGAGYACFVHWWRKPEIPALLAPA